MQDSQIDPELFNTIKDFVGQTYSRISEFDNSLTETGGNIRPIKHQFKEIANKVFQEIIPQSNIPRQPIQNHQNIAYIDSGRVPEPPPKNDPNQMEFNFNKTKFIDDLDKKMDLILNRLNKIDKKLDDMLESSYYEDKDIES